VIGYRHVDRRYPFLWEGPGQPPARWNDAGEPPTQYFSDTPDGAWAEFLRHEEITDPEDVETIRRALWAVELGEARLVACGLSGATLTGGSSTYPACRSEARRLRYRGAPGLSALAAALRPGGAAGWRVAGGLQRAQPRDGRTIVLFGERPDLVGWKACDGGHPGPELLDRTRPARR
jgi:RES domain